MADIYPNKAYRYRFIIAGVSVNPGLIQKVTVPEQSISVEEHGYSGDLPNKGTAGKSSYGDLVIERLVNIGTNSDFSFQAWLAEALASPITGEKFVVFEEQNLDGSVNRAWNMYSVFPKTITQNESTNTESANRMETITCEVWACIPSTDTLFDAIKSRLA